MLTQRRLQMHNQWNYIYMYRETDHHHYHHHHRRRRRHYLHHYDLVKDLVCRATRSVLLNVPASKKAVPDRKEAQRLDSGWFFTTANAP